MLIISLGDWFVKVFYAFKSKKSVKVHFQTVFNNIENALDIMLNEKQARKNCIYSTSTTEGAVFV